MSEVSDTAALHIPRSFREYYPEFAVLLKQTFPLIRYEEGSHENLMPLLLAGEVPHAVMMWVMNGDNWETALVDMFNAHVLTQNLDAAGANVQRLGVFAPFADLRQDRRSRKPVPNRPVGEMAIVKSQASWTYALARLMKYVAGVEYYVGIDGHSALAATQMMEQGIDVLYVTTAYAMMEWLQERGFLNQRLDTIFCGVDFGNLPLAHDLSTQFDLPMAIIRKFREAKNGGTKSTTTHELVYGEVRGKRVVVIDDMVSSGGTLIKTVELLLSHQAAEILVCAAHPVFAGRDYYEQLQDLLKYDRVKVVLTTNTLPLERPRFGGDRSQPYILKPAGEESHAPLQKRRVEMMPVTSLTGEIVATMLQSSSVAALKTALGRQVITLQDSYDLFENITHRKLERPKDVAVYRGEGAFEMLPGM